MKKAIRTFILAALTAAAGFTIVQDLFADRRSYVWTYEYATMPKGMYEIEYYLTEEQPDISAPKLNTWRHYIELEYGINSRLDAAFYQRFKQNNSGENSDFQYDGFKFRIRYRIADKDKMPLDTLLYLEYIKDDDFDKPDAIEGKIVFSKQIDAFNLSYNQILKQELEPDGEAELEYAVGLSYAVVPQLKLAIESKGNYTKEKYYIGPTLSWATGKFWTAVGVTAGLNHRSDDMQARLIIGISF